MSEPTRERVRATIGLVGGYWRPLAAVARLLEELGELAESLESRTPDVEQCASELADLWIITTAMADQFLGCVAEPDSHAPRSSRRCDLLGSIVSAAGQIARIVNYYDGPKRPRKLDDWVTLNDAVAELHRTLADAARAYAIDLRSAVNAKLDAIPTIDSGRFRRSDHDPSTAPSLEMFHSALATGPHAGRMRLWGGPEGSAEDGASPVEEIAAQLVSFTRAAVWERLDGYLIAGPSFATTGLLDDWLGQLLVELADRNPIRDPRRSDRVTSGAVDGEQGHLLFNGLRLRVMAFSSLYETTHPRFSSGGTFVLLQVGGDG